MNIYLIRHGRQNSSLCNVDVSLSDEGKEQAHLLGTRLEKYKPDIVYSSNLLRAVETADIVCEHLKGVPHIIREDLREIDFGDLTGHTDEYNQTNYGDFLNERKALKEDIAFPGGECGRDVYKRAMKVIDEIKKLDCRKVAVVTHGGTIRSLVTGILHMSQENKLLLGVSLENCSITELVYEKEYDRFYLERFNDFSHLEGKTGLLRAYWNREG